MLKVNFVEENGKFYLFSIEFESLDEVNEYIGRWFPTQEPLFIQVMTREEAKDKCLN